MLIIKAIVFLIFIGGSLATQQNAQKKALFEIIFVIDGSESIGEENFKIVKEWLVNQTVKIYETFREYANVGVLQFSNKDNPWDGVPIEDSKKFVIPFVLGERVNNASCFLPRIMTMPYLNSATYTYYALRRVMEVEFPKSPSYATSTKAVIVMTDGEANDGAFLRGWHEKYKHMVYPISIGVGQYEKFLNQLQNIANGGTGNDRVFTFRDFSALRESSSDIITALINSITSCVDPFVGNSCPSYCPATCDNPSPICKQACAPPGCSCPKGYLLSKSDNGTTCVLPENCPAKTCIFPEVHTNCAQPCLRTCSDPNPLCPEICQLNQCVCAKGYIRKRATNLTCILEDECPEELSTCSSPMIYNECASEIPETCETINNKQPKRCSLKCSEDPCICIKGMVFLSLTDRTCIDVDSCSSNHVVVIIPVLLALVVLVIICLQ
ncbi:transmembrane cell adhesion receptor mua-3-like isoform X2 [Styela clava]